jgi:predicted DNA-binding protein (MmcQ/YjbR family)
MAKDQTKTASVVLTELRRICAPLPGAEEYVMVHHPAFRVGKKPFVIAGMNQGVQGATVSINLGREMQHQLLDDPRFSKTRYIGQHGWVTISHAQVPKSELSALVLESFRRVANKKQLAQLSDASAPASADSGRAQPATAGAKSRALRGASQTSTTKPQARAPK